MRTNELINKKITIAEKRVLELTKSNDLKKLSETEKHQITNSAREVFTYNATSNVEEYHAKQAINTAEEFINTIRQVIISK